MGILIGLVATLLFAGSVVAQQQPYANLQTRSIKTLSDQQIADLNAGRGMGLALAAESRPRPQRHSRGPWGLFYRTRLPQCQAGG